MELNNLFSNPTGPTYNAMDAGQKSAIDQDTADARNYYMGQMGNNMGVDAMYKQQNMPNQLALTAAQAQQAQAQTGEINSRTQGLNLTNQITQANLPDTIAAAHSKLQTQINADNVEDITNRAAGMNALAGSFSGMNGIERQATMANMEQNPDKFPIVNTPEYKAHKLDLATNPDSIVQSYSKVAQMGAQYQTQMAIEKMKSDAGIKEAQIRGGDELEGMKYSADRRLDVANIHWGNKGDVMAQVDSQQDPVKRAGMLSYAAAKARLDGRMDDAQMYQTLADSQAPVITAVHQPAAPTNAVDSAGNVIPKPRDAVTSFAPKAVTNGAPISADDYLKQYGH